MNGVAHASINDMDLMHERVIEEGEDFNGNY